jgi:NAD(P)-dependent dehydrogenase (short-subunit alcohol dehydrogenase family)
MTGKRPTTFVTGAAGFIGTELVKVLIAGGHQVFALAQCTETAERVRRAGAVPVMGDLLEAVASAFSRTGGRRGTGLNRADKTKGTKVNGGNVCDSRSVARPLLARGHRARALWESA